MKTWKAYRELILYVFFGGVTTLVNLVVFKLACLWMGNELYLIANVVAWVAAVAVAYVTNKLWVFESRSWRPAVLAREIPSFIGARVVSLLMEEAGLFLTIDLLGWGAWSLTVWTLVISGEMICKLIMQVMVVILNYIFSKLVIFKNKHTDPPAVP